MGARVGPGERVGRVIVAASAAWFIAMSLGAQRASAQDSVSLKVLANTGTAQEGSRDGKSAAEERPVSGRAMVGFIGGLPIGFLGILVLQGDPGGAIGIGSGAAIIGAAWRVGTAKPPLSPYIQSRGETYARFYSESYEERLLERRRNAALLGGLAGSAIGFGFLVLLLSQYTS
jgi:hypothetical protein